MLQLERLALSIMVVAIAELPEAVAFVLYSSSWMLRLGSAAPLMLYTHKVDRSCAEICSLVEVIKSGPSPRSVRVQGFHNALLPSFPPSVFMVVRRCF
jgi:hypothetical protein